MTGDVAAFDEHVGLGTVRASDGTEYGFHCTAITDGTRTIKQGTTVEFDIVPGPAGRWEATKLAALVRG